MKKIIFIAIILLSCESSSLDNYKPIPENEIDIGKGSAAFTTGDYDEAIQHFENALTSAKTNGQKSIASAGLGFAKLRKSSATQTEAETFFNQALVFNPDNNDAKCGLMFFDYNDPLKHSSSIAYAESILSSNDNFKMTFDGRIDRNDLLITIALIHFYDEHYDSALTAIKRISGLSAYNVDINSTSGIQNLSDKISDLIEIHKQ